MDREGGCFSVFSLKNRPFGSCECLEVSERTMCVYLCSFANACRSSIQWPILKDVGSCSRASQ